MTRRIKVRIAHLAVAVPLAFLALTQTAGAATQPVPSPGPPVVPLSAPASGFLSVLFTGSFASAALIVIAVLGVLMVVFGHRSQPAAAAATTPIFRQGPVESEHRGESAIATRPGRDSD